MKILVPYDFTPITRTALDHAFALGRTLEGEIALLHIIENESKRGKAEAGFNTLFEGLTDEERSVLTAHVRVGDIFKDITKEAEAGDYQLLVMGTHGAKGLQKVLGSKAIKVITSGNTPFIVTQSKGPSGSIKRIVLPVDLTKESVQIVKFAAQIAKRFSAEIHIVGKNEKDEWLNNKLKNNIAYLRRVLKEEGVKHVVAGLDGKKALAQEVMEYGAAHRADLYAVAHFSESILPQFDRFSQDMITNPALTPVLIANASAVGGVKGQYSFLTV